MKAVEHLQRIRIDVAAREMGIDPAELRAFAGSADQHDDMTMILLKIEASTEAAA